MFKIFSSAYPAKINDNCDKTILSKILWIVPILMTGALATSMLLEPDYIYRYCIILAVLWIVSLMFHFIWRKQHLSLKVILYISFLLLMIFITAWTGGGIKGHSIRFLPVVVLLSGLLLGRKGIWSFGAFAITGCVLLILSNYYGLLAVNESIGHSDIIYWLTVSTCILMLCFVENLSVQELRAALSVSENELILRKKSEEQLLTKNHMLTDIAFLQSHMVRKPLSNVIGLINLLTLNQINESKKPEIIAKLEICAKELDAVVVEIVKRT